MTRITRRSFGGALLAGFAAPRLHAASRIDSVLRESLQRRGIPSVVAMACNANSVLYSGAFGDAKLDSIFNIASMTKPVASVAAMQLVEQGKIELDEPAANHLPELGDLQVLSGFDGAGKPVLRPAQTQVTLRHLLTHTSGFSYPTWHAAMNRYTQATAPLGPGTVAPLVPLMFEPGTSWQYGYSADWTGKLVEKISGLTLEQYFQRHIFGPIGMRETSYILPPEKFARMATRYGRGPNGNLQAQPRVQPQAPAQFNGGGGLYSTAADYIQFVQMFLRYGRAGAATDILKGSSIAAMSLNQIGSITAGVLRTQQPNVSSDLNAAGKWGLGFLINPERLRGGRQAGSLTWGGIFNTYFWIDPVRRMGGVVMMQYLPFADTQALGLLGDFERAIYAG